MSHDSRAEEPTGVQPPGHAVELEIHPAFGLFREAAFLTDSDGRILGVNPQACSMLGYSRDKLLALSLSRLCSAAAREDMHARWLDARRFGEGRFEAEWIRADGENIYVDLYVRPSSNGYFAAVARDITPRKQVEAALRESEERYRSLVESAEETIATVDREGRFLFANPTAAQRLNMSPEQVVGKTMWDLFPRQLADRQMATVRRVIDSGEPALIERDTVVAGRTRAYRTSVAPVRGASGEIVSALIIGRDVTALARARERLRRQEEEYRDLVENLHVGIVRSSGGPKGRLLKVNAAVLDMFGYERREQVAGLDLAEAYARPEERLELLRDLKANGVVRDRELLLKKADQSPIWVRFTSRAELDDAGEIRWIDSVIEDVTERKWLEKAYRDMAANSLQGMLIVQDGKVVFSNAAFCDLSGYSAAELAKMTEDQVKAVVHRDDRPKIWDRYRQTGDAPDRPGRYEARLLRRDGSMRWVEVFPCGIEYYGRPAMQAAFVDVTERHEAEQRLADSYAELERRVAQRTEELRKSRESLERHRDHLEDMVAERTSALEFSNQTLQAEIRVREKIEAAMRESEANFRALADNANEAIVIAYPDGRLVYANPCAAELTGYTVGQLLELKTLALFSPEEHQLVAEVTRRRLLGDPVPASYETKVRRRDGGAVSVEISGARTVWRGWPATIGMIRDVTARKEAEQALRRSERMLAEAQQVAGIGSWDWDLGTNRVTWSDHLYRMLGHDRERFALTFDSSTSMVHPEDVGAMREAVRAAIEECKPYRTEMRVTRKDGEERVFLAQGQVVREEKTGRPERLVGTVLDVTERRQLERDILEVVRREQSRIGQTLHDSLGQELTGIGYLVKALEHDVKGGVCPSLEDIDRVSSLVSGAANLTRQLAKGLSPVESDPEGLANALRNLALSTRQMFRISCRCAVVKPGLVHDNAIATHLFHIAQEAVTNAVRHGKAKHVRIRFSTRASGGKLTVADDGRGLPDGYEHSEGMGLRIMRYRSEMIGGTLDLHKDAEGGAVVVCEYQDRGQRPAQQVDAGLPVT